MGPSRPTYTKGNRSTKILAGGRVMPDSRPGWKTGQGEGAGWTRGLSVISTGDSGVTANNLVS